MKRIFKKVFKSEKPSLGSIHGPGPATPTSTDLMQSIPFSEETVQVTTGVSVSVQLQHNGLLVNPSHL